MKTKRMRVPLVLVAIILTALNSFSALAASRVAFDNQSGSPALVKLVGPTGLSVSVENGTKESISVAPGHYFIRIRYGRLGGYSFSKGDEFDVKETATKSPDIAITLHKVVAGNYGSEVISQAEFDGASAVSMAAGSRWQESLPPWVAAAQEQLSFEVKVEVNTISMRTGGNGLMFVVNGGVTNRGTQKFESTGKPAILFTVRTPDSSPFDGLSLRLPLSFQQAADGGFLTTSFGLGGRAMKEPDLLGCASEVLSYNDGGTTRRLIVVAHGMTLSKTTTDMLGTHRKYSRPTSVVWPYDKEFLQRFRDAEKESLLGICARLLTEQIDKGEKP